MPVSAHAGMGAIGYAGGVAFRVWAPFAHSVAVAGDFNGWSPSADLLSAEGAGYWSIDINGASVGQGYKFVIVNDGTTLWRNDPLAREVDIAKNNSVVYDPTFDWQGEAFTMPPWNELVIYELHVGTFNDLSTSVPGRFQGVIDKLDYLHELGINAIEIMAAGEFDMDFSWGYNPAYIFAIASSYGGIPAFKEFVRAAHRHGIAVIFDAVYNHLGYPSEDMWRFDGWYKDDDGGLYFYNDWRCTTPWGCTRFEGGFNSGAFERVIYTESHDEDANGQSRVPEEIWPGNAGSWYSKKRSTLGAALVLTAPGIPMIFQGQEFLENGSFSDRNRLDWTKAQAYSGIISLYRELARLRRNWYDNTRGLRGQWVNVYHVNNADKVVAFHRWEHGGARDDVVVVANFGSRGYANYNVGFPRPGLWRVRFNSDWSGYSPDFGDYPSDDTTANDGPRDGLSYQGNVGIGPYSAIILSQEG